MRLRVGAVLCLFLAFWGAGCRKALTPLTLDNQAPETWITAAPQDTITTRDSNNVPIRQQPGKIPVRFHLYWAGSDRDGSVVGYYFAVVETLPVPPEGTSTVPALPGPKPRDYHFTAKSDSIFIFDASEEVSERQHAFFIYAVDNKGRPDPTPARFVFSAYDRFPPLAIIDELKAEGTEYQLLPGGGVTPVTRTYFVRDSFEISNTHSFPRDTISANAQISIKWHGEPTIPSTVVTGFRYKLDEPNFNTVDSSVKSTNYNTGVGLDKVNPGPKIFTLRAIGQSGWRGESTRWFQMNFAPDTWFAGPDPNDPLAGWQVQQDNNGKRYWSLDLAFTGWPGTPGNTFPGVPGTMLSPDSLRLLPSSRTERKSFFEVYNNRLWLRQEDDTVHMNSWVVIPSGGFDRDSPYRVRVNVPLLPPEVAGTLVGTPDGPNGSPIGFRIKVQVKDLAGGITQPSETTTYPVYDPASVFHQPVINGYWGLTAAGRAFAVIRAEDGDGTVDRRIDQRPGEAAGVVERVEANAGSAEDIALRSKILTFYVDRVPTLRRDNTFRPRTTDILTRKLSLFQLPADDPDQYDFNAGFNKVGGTPAYAPILRRKIAIIGKATADPTKTICYVVNNEFNGVGTNIGPIEIPDSIATGNIIVRIRLCDCVDCDVTAGKPDCAAFKSLEANASHGRCTEVDIPCRVAATEPASILGGANTGAGAGTGGKANSTGSTGTSSTSANSRPGSPLEPGRRQQ